MRSEPLLSWLSGLAPLLTASLGAQEAVGPPPRELAGSVEGGAHVMTSFASGIEGVAGVEGAVTYDMLERTVVLHWWRNFPAQQRREGSTQVEHLSLWPTAVCSFGTDRVCVAGKDPRGQTVIQSWRFSTSEVFEPASAQSTGELFFPDTLIPVASTTTVYEGDVPGHRLVRALFANHGAPDKLFVQFHDSRDLYELDTATHALSLKVSSASDPRLARSFDGSYTWNHLQRGYLYCMGMEVNENGAPESLIFVDANRDGTLDLANTLYLVGGDQWKETFADQTLLTPAF